jgi:hypothetical protein
LDNVNLLPCPESVNSKGEPPAPCSAKKGIFFSVLLPLNEHRHGKTWGSTTCKLPSEYIDQLTRTQHLAADGYRNSVLSLLLFNFSSALLQSPTSLISFLRKLIGSNNARTFVVILDLRAYTLLSLQAMQKSVLALLGLVANSHAASDSCSTGPVAELVAQTFSFITFLVLFFLCSSFPSGSAFELQETYMQRREWLVLLTVIQFGNRPCSIHGRLLCL